MVSRVRRTLVIGVLVILLSVQLGACSSTRPHITNIDYFTDAKPVTLNANTVAGRSGGSLMVLARVLPGFSYTQPQGGSVLDRDMGTAQPMPGEGEEFTVRYSLHDHARWSDGTPMTCLDVKLAWAALSGRLPGAQPASTLGYELISAVNCEQNPLVATAVFRQYFPSWSGLFGAGTLLPAHVLEQKTGVDLNAALESDDEKQLRAAGSFWNSGWNFSLDGPFDPTFFPSNGPYRLAAIDHGKLTLTRNDRWWGDPGQLTSITVWTKGSRPPSSGSLIIDMGKDSFSHLSLPSRSTQSIVHSLGIEQLVLSSAGVLKKKEAREALAQCVPRQALASLYGGGSSPAPGAISSSNDVWQVASAHPIRYEKSNLPASYRARESATPGRVMTLRVGYLAPDARRAAMVRFLSRSCRAAGINIVDASKDFTPQGWNRGALDVVITSSDLATAEGGTLGPGWTIASAAEVRSGDAENLGGFSNPDLDDLILQLTLCEEEDERITLLTTIQEKLWEQLTVIPLFAQPRLVAWTDTVQGVVPSTAGSATGWNMDRWSSTT